VTAGVVEEPCTYHEYLKAAERGVQTKGVEGL